VSTIGSILKQQFTIALLRLWHSSLLQLHSSFLPSPFLLLLFIALCQVVAFSSAPRSVLLCRCFLCYPSHAVLTAVRLSVQGGNPPCNPPLCSVFFSFSARSCKKFSCFGPFLFSPSGSLRLVLFAFSWWLHFQHALRACVAAVLLCFALERKCLLALFSLAVRYVRFSFCLSSFETRRVWPLSCHLHSLTFFCSSTFTLPPSAIARRCRKSHVSEGVKVRPQPPPFPRQQLAKFVFLLRR